MVKSGYVNNLSDMREQLRRNYRNPDDIVASPASESAASAPRLEENAPVHPVRSEAARDFRDLEGRALSALAQLECELGRIDFCRDQLTARRDRLNALLQEMQNPASDRDEAEYQRRVDSLRYRFFEIAVPVSGKTSNSEEKENAATARNAWIVASAVLAGAVIVALALFFSF
ncbi:MAG: hypothetical protein MJ016_07170 [Victivallaceae bacterium]|nr:hypothetical protein [Victivallaceae bacterium]